MPSVKSSSIVVVEDSSTVMTPSLPTLSNASAISAADRGVLGGDRGDVRDVVLAVDVAGGLEQRVADGVHGLVDAALEAGRRGAGGHVAQALLDHGLGEHGRGRRAVTGDVVGLGRDLLGELGAEVLVRVVQLDLAGDGHAVVGDGGGAPRLADDHVAALRAEGHLDGVGERVDAALERLARVVVELEGLGHVKSGAFRRRIAVRDRPGRHRKAGPAGAVAVRAQSPADVTSRRSRGRRARRG